MMKNILQNNKYLMTFLIETRAPTKGFELKKGF